MRCLLLSATPGFGLTARQHHSALGSLQGVVYRVERATSNTEALFIQACSRLRSRMCSSRERALMQDAFSWTSDTPHRTPRWVPVPARNSHGKVSEKSVLCAILVSHCKTSKARAKMNFLAKRSSLCDKCALFRLLCPYKVCSRAERAAHCDVSIEITTGYQI